MIERYSRPEMKKIWTDDNKYQNWLKVELAACEAWTELGVIPKEDMVKLRKATLNPERLAFHLKETHHDVTAFLRAVGETIGEESRFIHLGMTSSDVMDTAQSLQILQSIAILEDDVNKLLAAISTLAVKHKHTVQMGRTHGVHAEPTSFGLKLALWVTELRRSQERLAEAKKINAVGKRS